MKKIQTERLELRVFDKKDYNALLEIYKNPEVCQYLLHEPWDDNKQSEDTFFKKVENNFLSEEKPLSIAVTLNNQVIGDIDCWYTGMKDTVEVGFTFHPDYQGKGYASEALHAIFTMLFDEHKVHRITAMLDARNQASAGLCNRVGMRQEAHFIQDYWSKGEWTDTFVYGILSTEYKNNTR